MNEKNNFFVFIEQKNGILENTSLEVLAKAKDLSKKLKSKVIGILLGYKVNHIAEEVSRRGADKVIVVDSQYLKDYNTLIYSDIIKKLVEKENPRYFLLGATYNGVDLASRLAIKLKSGLMAHVIDLEIEEESKALLGHVPGFGGNIVAVCKCKKGRPEMATVKPGIFKSLEKSEAKGKIEYAKFDIKIEDIKTRVVERKVVEFEDISKFERVVIAGLGCIKDLSLAKKLAETIQGKFATTRPLADKGLASKDQVVGSTGYSLNSKIAIILGASGASHFVSGIRNVGTVIAINKDKNAPIFEHSDYCIADDLFKILPILISNLKKMKGE